MAVHFLLVYLVGWGSEFCCRRAGAMLTVAAFHLFRNTDFQGAIQDSGGLLNIRG